MGKKENHLRQGCKNANFFATPIKIKQKTLPAQLKCHCLTTTSCLSKGERNSNAITAVIQRESYLIALPVSRGFSPLRGHHLPQGSSPCMPQGGTWTWGVVLAPHGPAGRSVSMVLLWGGFTAILIFLPVNTFLSRWSAIYIILRDFFTLRRLFGGLLPHTYQWTLPGML